MIIEMLVLANSKKSGGRCLAGIPVDGGSWIRPVSTTHGGEISTQLCSRGSANDPLRPLDVISIDIGEKLPAIHQNENVAFVESSIRYTYTATPEESGGILKSLSKSMPWFLTNPTTKIDASSYLVSGAPTESLALIEVQDLVIETNIYGKRRALFRFNEIDWDLPMTDEHFPSEVVAIPNAFLCLSIGEAYVPPQETSGHPWHYKLVAGIIPFLPDFLVETAELGGTMMELCDTQFGFVPILVDERNKKARFNSPGWFLQGRPGILCPSCSTEQLVVARKHYTTVRLPMHYWGIACLNCRSLKDSKDFDRRFIKSLEAAFNETVPVKALCLECLEARFIGARPGQEAL